MAKKKKSDHEMEGDAPEELVVTPEEQRDPSLPEAVDEFIEKPREVHKKFHKFKNKN